METHATTHDSHTATHHHHEHPELTFFQKYVFSMDHKMISKQFLFTAMFMAVAVGHYEHPVQVAIRMADTHFILFIIF